MTKKPELLKINEVRTLVKKHKREDLEYIIAELYKAIPKQKVIDHDIADLITHPEKMRSQRKTKKPSVRLRPFSEIEKETEKFVSNAYNQYYLIPNRVVKKSERSKWRFLVKRLYKELIQYGKQEEYQKQSAELLKKLYEVLTYSCAYTLFTAYDSFDSTGIEQTAFFLSVIDIYHKFQDKPDFISSTIDLIINNSLNRYTLYSDLMNVFLEYMNIPDLLYTTIEKSKEKREILMNTIPVNRNWSTDYKLKEKKNNCTELIFRSYAGLFEFDNALTDFKKYYIEDNNEVKLYVLVRLLMEFDEKDLILNELQEAEKQIKIRQSLIELKNFILQNDYLPEYIY